MTHPLTKLLLLSLVCLFPFSTMATENTSRDAKTLLNKGLLSYRDNDRTKALEYFQQAAELNNPIAQDILANAYALGKYGLKINQEKAIALWKKSAAQDNLNAHSNLASIYLRDMSTPQIAQQAEKHLKFVAKAGNIIALTNLGILYVKQGHHFEGVYRLIMAAKAGYPTAKTALLTIGIKDIPPLPGESMASPLNVQQIMPSVKQQAIIRAGDDCADSDSLQVIDSRILAKPTSSRQKDQTLYRISEEWLVKMCKKDIPVTVEFTYTSLEDRTKDAKIKKEIDALLNDSI